MKPGAGIEIMRPLNGLMGSITIITGILNTHPYTGSFILLTNIILACLVFFFIVSSAMIINDIYDYKIDMVNRPGRPIPRGDLSLEQARALYWVTAVTAILLAVFHSIFFNITFISVMLALFFLFIGWIYAAYGKRSGFPGNILVSFSFAAGLIYGAIISGSSIPGFIYLFFLTTFSLMMAREIIKDCEDVMGDRQQGARTLAIILGKRRSALISACFGCAAIVFFVLTLYSPFANQPAYLVLMITGIAIVLYAVTLTLISDLNQEAASRISFLFKIGAFAGLLAFVAASIDNITRII